MSKKIDLKVSKDKYELREVILQSKMDECVEKFTELLKVEEEYSDNIKDLKLLEVLSFIDCGNYLLECKSEFNTGDFKTLCKKFPVSQKTLDRYMDLVSDTRVSVLTIKELRVMKNSSKSKLENMKGLTDKQFKSTLKGNDTYYTPEVERLEKIKLNNLTSKYPNISDKVYRELKKGGFEYTVDYLNKEINQQQKNISTKLRKNVSQIKRELLTLDLPKGMDKNIYNLIEKLIL